jgi:glucosylceramidase
LQVTAALNLDGSIAVVVFNEGITQKSFKLLLGQKESSITISGQSIQTILINTI